MDVFGVALEYFFGFCTLPLLFDEKIIDRIYEAAALPELWPDILNDIARSADGDGAVLFTANHGKLRWTASPNMHEIMHEFIRDGWALINPRPARFMEVNHPGFVRDSDLFTDAEIATDPVYKFVRQKGLGFTVGTMIDTPSGDTLVFSFERAFRKGPVPIDLVKEFDALRPHLARSALLSTRLGFERAKAMTDTLQSVGLPAALLRHSGSVLAVNASFDKLIPSLIQDKLDRIHVTSAQADALLAEALARQSTPSRKFSTNSIPVAASDDDLASPAGARRRSRYFFSSIVAFDRYASGQSRGTVSSRVAGPVRSHTCGSTRRAQHRRSADR